MKNYKRSTSEERMATTHPTTLDIAWAAGLYEGEGYAGPNKGHPYVCLSQNNPWVCNKLKELFGGTVRTREVDKKRNPHISTVWFCSGSRASGFIMTIYKFLSPRRKLQALLAMERITIPDTSV